MKILSQVVLLFFVSTAAYAQVSETTKIDEFGLIYCCDFGARVDNAELARKNNPGSMIYVTFYNARKHRVSRWDKSGNQKTVWIDPIRGEYRGFVTGFMKQISFFKLDPANFKIRDGGYREQMVVELWLVPSGAAPPPLTPTVDEKNIRFRKGTSHFAHVCDDI